jgi:hypothetical protein
MHFEIILLPSVRQTLQSENRVNILSGREEVNAIHSTARDAHGHHQWSSTWGTPRHLRGYAKTSYGVCKIEKKYFLCKLMIFDVDLDSV